MASLPRAIDFRQISAGHAVDDEAARFRGQLDLVGQRRDAARGADAAHRAVGNDQQAVQREQRAARDVLQAGFAVDHDVAVVPRQLVQHLAQHVVGETVAALAFGPAHHDQVVAVLLDQRLLHAQVQKLLLRDALQRLRFRARALADAADGGAKRLPAPRAGWRWNRRPPPAPASRPAAPASRWPGRTGGLADPAFSCHR